MAQRESKQNPVLIDVTKLSEADIDKLDPNALKEALKAVIRPASGAGLMHRDHNSHSNHD